MLERRRGLAKDSPVRLRVLYENVQPRTGLGLVEIHDDTAPCHASEVLRRVSPYSASDHGENFRRATVGFVHPCKGPVHRTDTELIVLIAKRYELELEMDKSAIRKRNIVEAFYGSPRLGNRPIFVRKHFHERPASSGLKFRIGSSNNAYARISHAIRRWGLRTGIGQNVHSTCAGLPRTIGAAKHLQELIALMEGFAGWRHDIIETSHLPPLYVSAWDSQAQ